MLGVCYYPEHWPKNLWAKDAQQMRELGLTYVRIGEFCWSRVEPRPGLLQFDWLDEAIDVLADAGLKVILGTPTATPPKWLIDQYPEILPLDPDTLQTRGFGSRRHYDFSSEIYFQESLRITRLFAERYGNHPGVIGWQTDNELCCHDTTLSGSTVALHAFRAWCENEYGSIDRLNHAWGTVFWSMEYRDFSEIELPIAAVTETSPAHRLAYRRFSSERVIRYHDAMIAEIRKHSPDKWITHNFIPTCDTNVDNFALADKLDFTSYDNYPLGRSDLNFSNWDASTAKKYMRTGHPDYATFFHDQTRGLSHGEYWVMEQQPGPVNWAHHNPHPAQGMVRLWSLEAIAHGATCISYFRWRQVPFAQEQMHSGLLRPDQTPSSAWPEVQQFKEDLAAINAQDLPKVDAKVAILINIEGQWISDIERQGEGYDFWQVEFQYYSAFRQLGVDVDFINEAADFDQYSLVVAPNLPIIRDELVDKIEKSQSTFIFGPRSGAKGHECDYPQNLPPGPLQHLVPFRILSVETTRPDCKDAFTWNETSYYSHSWREEISLESNEETKEVHSSTKLLAIDENELPVVVKRNNVHYIGALTCDQFLLDYFRHMCKSLDISTLEIHPDIRISRRGDLVFAFNYDEVSHSLPIKNKNDILVGDLDIQPRNVTIWRQK